MQNTSRFDDFLFTIVKETGGLEGLLNSLFSFLARRTDFFYEADPGDKMGFPPGYAQRMVLGMMDGYQKEHYKKYPKKDPAEYNAKLKKLQEAKEKEKKEEETKASKEPQKTESNKPTASPAQPTGTTTIAVENKTTAETQKASEKIEEEDTAVNKAAPKDPKVTAISTYNGAATDKYNWSQNINEVTVQVPLPPGTRAKNLAVDITSTKLKVVLKTDNRTLIEGEWYERVKADDSTWSVDEDTIVLNLEKANENIWKSVLKGDQEIDATKVDNSKPIQDFDTETQGALRKIVYEQQRKQMGLPSTEEEQQMEMLKKAWNAEGSPWKGTPFDPTKFNLPGSNSMNFDNSS